MRARIAVLPGDGIGPEVTAQAVRVLAAVARDGGLALTFEGAPIGAGAIAATGDPLPPETLAICRGADAVLLGAVGGAATIALESGLAARPRPEDGLLRLRRELGVYANLRPVRPHDDLLAASPLRADVVRGADLLFVRELTGGIYFGERRETADEAEDLCRYDASEVRRVVRVAARLAGARRGKLTSVDKANVLATSRLWRRVAAAVVAEEFPDLELEHALVDSFAMRLVARPRDFDVVVTENLFGDILSDEAAILSGSLGLLPSASLGDEAPGLFEPVHGSAPELAGRGVANPVGAILSAALLLRHALGLEREARAIESAVASALANGAVTADCGGSARTTEVGDAVLAALGLGDLPDFADPVGRGEWS